MNNYLFRCYIRFPNEYNFMLNSMNHNFEEPHLLHFIHYYLYLPYHTSLIRSISSQYPSYSDTTRLIKIWMSIHMNSIDFSTEVIDLLVAYVYIHSEPNLPPKNPFLGFIRFLQFITTFSFTETPIIIDNLSNFTIQDKQDIMTQFNTINHNEKPIYIVTAFHKDYEWKSFLTNEYPRKEIFQRLRIISNKSLNTISSLYNGVICNRNENNDIETNNICQKLMKSTVFKLQYSDFDMVINCDEKYCIPISKYLKSIPLQNKTVKNNGKNYNIEIYTNLLDSIAQKMLIDYNPIKLLIDELNSKYSYLGFFLYDSTFNNKICVIFKPMAFLPVPFKISECSDSIPIESNGEMKYTLPNMLEIVNAIKESGRGLITDIKIEVSQLLSL